MLKIFLIILGKALSKIIKMLNLGNGSTWPGHIAISIDKNFIRKAILDSKLKTILIAGTNGKTTTANLIRTVLENNGKTVIQNLSGANLLNGIASSLILNTDMFGKINHDFAILEIDENMLPKILKEFKPDYIVLLNLFRDQLDRYGEVDSIVSKWKENLNLLNDETKLITNADDPAIFYLVNNLKTKKYYFGLDKKNHEKKSLEHAADSIYCPKCGKRLKYIINYYSHLGLWYCSNCGLSRPKTNVLSSFAYYPLKGEYNMYNTHAALTVLKQLGFNEQEIIKALRDFKPAFGRQEKIKFENKNVQILLSKNPTSFNESLRTIKNLNAKTVLFLLNDKIADGKDISWIWDIDFPKFKNIFISGTRAYDMALRIKYDLLPKNSKERIKYETFKNTKMAVKESLKKIGKNETLYILPTYTSMLEVRKILTGKSIL